MGNKKKMKLPFLSSQSKSLDPKIYSSSSSSYSSSQPWPFPSCANIRTLSFKAKEDDDAFRTFNSAFVDADESTLPESYFSTVSSSSRSFSTMSDDDSGDPLESVIHGLRSERLFFDPEQSSSLLLCQHEKEPEHETRHEHEQGGSTSSSMKYGDESKEEVAYIKESEILSMDSSSPYEDFRKSMEEMVEAHGLKDWQGLEELLGCYLKINGKHNHGYIVGAFIDLLVSLSLTSCDESTSSTTSTTTTTTSTTNITPTTTITTTTTTTTSSSYSNYSSPSSPLSLPSSSLTTPCLSSTLDHGDDGHDDDDGDDKHHDDDVDDDHVTC